ncbi:hypothetical protein VH571_08570 [Frondihabitans sp. 4ASC-45]|uniref:hypothetical protein n=1 Tax=Frondihabitans sp. 4ASC-45 TaxID=3111636 RepID=UPI003C199063
MIGRRGVMVAGGSTLVLGTALALAAVAGSSERPSSPSVDSSASVRNTFLDNVSDSLSVAGGAWTFENKTTPFSLARARTHTPVECLSDSTTEQYDLALYGDPPKDPRTAARALADHWTERGFKVTTVVDNADGIELRADTPDGSLLDYAASTSLSSLVFQSACVKSVG